MIRVKVRVRVRVRVSREALLATYD